MSSPTERFTNRVDDYVKYRPHYPKEIVSLLESTYQLNHNWIIADIGSGTGISSSLFLQSGYTVWGIEPNEAMRKAAESYLADFSTFTSIHGRSEATSLEDQSVDLIIAAQAFHWFELDNSRREFLRILKSPHRVVLMWNSRRFDTPFLKDYETLLTKYSNDYRTVNHQNTEEESVEEFFGEGNFQKFTFQNSQHLDKEGLRGRVRSSSYMPNKTHPTYSVMISDLDSLFDTYQQQGRVETLYNTQVYIGSL